MGLRLLQALEAQSVQRRALRVANARFDFAFAIRIAHATWEADDPIVREHVAIDGIERRVVDVRREHAFFEIVEDDEARRAAQPAKRPLVELGPRLRARVPDEQAHRFARVAERQDEEPRASVLGRLRMTDHRAVAVVDLRFFTRCRRDDDARFDGRAAAQLADEATDAGVASGETLLHEVLPDRHRVAPQFQGCFDLLAVRRTRARRRRATRRRVGGHLRLGNCRFCGWVGGHLPGNGRFCRPFARAATAPHRQPRLSISISYNPTPSTPLGFTARIAPAWGGESTSGAEALWGQETMAGMARGGVASGNRLDAEVGYGLPVGSRFVGTPRVGIGTSEMGRDYRLGYRLGARGGAATAVELGVDAQRRERPVQGGTDHGALARATVRW